jgi:hypothetical protein
MHADGDGDSVRADAMAWTALLGKWMEYAQAAKALPRDAEGTRWRAAVPHVITLQAVTLALREIDHVVTGDRAVARDRSAVMITTSVRALGELWSEGELPESLQELLQDAHDALALSAVPGLMELVWPGPGELVMPPAHGAGAPEEPGGTLFMMAPGTIVFPGECVAMFAQRPAPCVAGTVLRRAARMHQLFRVVDDEGRFVHTRSAPLEETVDSALLLLMPVWIGGQRVGNFLLPADEWLRVQRAAGVAVH